MGNKCLSSFSSQTWVMYPHLLLVLEWLVTVDLLFCGFCQLRGERKKKMSKMTDMSDISIYSCYFFLLSSPQVFDACGDVRISSARVVATPGGAARQWCIESTDTDPGWSPTLFMLLKIDHDFIFCSSFIPNKYHIFLAAQFKLGCSPLQPNLVAGLICAISFNNLIPRFTYFV